MSALRKILDSGLLQGQYEIHDRMQSIARDGLRSELETAAEVARLRGLLWYAWSEFNAIRARSGAPLDQYGMTLCDEAYWSKVTDAFADAIGPDATTPWPTKEAKDALP